MLKNLCFLILQSVAAVILAHADEIVIDGEKLEMVVVKESDSAYYVLEPKDGTIQVVAKSRIDPTCINLSDGVVRAELEAAWKVAREPKSDGATIGNDSQEQGAKQDSDDEHADSGPRVFQDGLDVDEHEPVVIRSKGNFKSDPMTKSVIERNLAQQRATGIARNSAKEAAKLQNWQQQQQILANADQQRRTAIATEPGVPIGVSRNVIDDDDRMFGYFHADGRYEPGTYVDLGPDWAAYRGRVPRTYP